MRRHLLGASAPAVLCVAAMIVPATAPAEAATDQRVRLLGSTRLPHAMEFEQTTVGGLSGIDFDRRTGEWVLISDDRSERQPARFYTADIPVGPEGVGPVELTGTEPLRRPDGTVYPPLEGGDGSTVDPEEVRVDPRHGDLWWTSEGERDERLIDPAIRVAGTSGTFRDELRLPDNLRMGEHAGPRQNEVLEGLTFAAGGALVVSAMEGPLIRDGESPTTEHGALSRITVQERSGEVLGQFAYPLDPVFAESPTGGFSNNGVSAILGTADPARYLVLERSYVTGVGNSIRIYQADVRGATDVADVDSLAGEQVRPVRKRLLADLSEFELRVGPVDNVEGMTWGPRLPGGERSLVLVSDDNFSPGQQTQLIALAVR
ncbi:esterase-like activity of phytase family protein [Parasphingorhabdus pacifica]